ncbi:MAG: hypothetical protein KDA84_15535, partial [Planctomycetaceae bacterium]|nr:hypothetical protein [Planctomycetaceae bacterium]
MNKPALFSNGQLEWDHFQELTRSLLVELVGVQTRTHCAQFCARHFFLALSRTQHEKLTSTLQSAIQPQKSLEELVKNLIEISTESETQSLGPQPLDESRFTGFGLELLTDLFVAESAGPLDVPAIAALICRHLSPRDRMYFQMFLDLKA